MSATNRGSEREETDFYNTPAFCTHALLRHPDVKLPGGNWLDPCAGVGALPTAMRQVRQDINWFGYELRYDFKPWLDWAFAPGQSVITDFLQLPQPGNFDVIYTNPPFSLASEFVRKCLPMAPWVVFLMRLNILGSGRYDIFSNEMPDHYVLSNRPSFKKNKNGKTSSDATEYAFFVWGPERGRKFGKSYILPTMSLSERKMLNSSIPQHSLIF